MRILLFMGLYCSALHTLVHQDTPGSSETVESRLQSQKKDTVVFELRISE